MEKSNTSEPIDPTKVVWDQEPIDPAKVVWDGERTKYTSMTAADRQQVKNAFAGDPLGFIADGDERTYVRSVTENFPDRDEYRQRMALAALFTKYNPGSDYRFNMANLDGILEKFYGRKTAVAAAYNDMAGLFDHKPETSTGKEFAAAAKQSAKEHAYALGAGSADLISGLTLLGIRAGNFSFQTQLDLARYLLPDPVSQKVFDWLDQNNSEGMRDLQKMVADYWRDVASDADRKANSNGDVLGNIISGDLDKISWTDFTKALMRSAPDMALQILIGAAAPYAVPAFIGVREAALKEYDVNQNNPDWGTAKKLSYIGLSAANEALLDMVTAKIMGGGMDKKTAAEIVKRGLWKYMKGAAVKEGGTEMLQQLGGNLLDYFYEKDGPHDDWTAQQKAAYIFRGVLESGFVGGAFGMPEAVTGYRSARELTGIAENVRVKHEERVKNLSQKEKLTTLEQVQLDNSKAILDTNDPVQLITADHLSSAVENEEVRRELRQSGDFAMIEEETAPDMPADVAAEAIEEGAQAKRNIALRKVITWNAADTVDAVVKYSPYFKDAKFHVLDTFENLPENLRSAAGGARAFVDFRTGEVYINASKVAPHQALEVMLHEVVGHMGLRAVIPEAQLDAFLDNVFAEHRDDPELVRIAQTYGLGREVVTGPEEDRNQDYVIDDPAKQRLAAEEYIAHLAQKEVKPSWWREILQKIRMALAKLPLFRDVTMTDRQIELLLARAGRKMRSRNNRAAVDVMWGGNKALNVGDEEGVRMSLFDNPVKKSLVIDALKKIANGEEEVTVKGIRNDLEQYGGTNDISFVWGNEKKGIYHIASRRGVKTLLHVVDAVSDGSILRYVAGNKTVIVEKDGYEAVLALTEFGNKKSWLLSGWKTNEPDAIGEVGTQSDATQLKPTFSRQELGAGLELTIAQSGEMSSGNTGNTGNTDGIRKSISPENENLVVLHNVSASKLRRAAKLGGLPVPSLAIVDAEKSDFSNFGEISLVADKNLIDPKRKGNKVFNADAYSPRAPQTKKFYSDADYDRAAKVLKPYDLAPDDDKSVASIMEKYKDGMYDSDLEYNLSETYAVLNWYCQDHGIETPAADNWKEVIHIQSSSEFNQWWNDVALPQIGLDPEEKMFAGTTNMGRPRWIPLTLENVVKAMTKKTRNGEGFNYGIGNIRSLKAVQFKSIAQIQSQRDHIVSEEDFKVLKKEIQDEFSELCDRMRAASGSNYGWEYNTGEDCLMAMAEGGRENAEYLHDRFGDNQELFREMAKFLDKLVNMPTEYFEAKPQRAVGLEEFRAAVIPENAPEDVSRMLQDAGLEIYTYGEGTSRKEALQMVTAKNNLRFSLAEYSDEDQRDIVAILRPFVGMTVERDAEDYQRYLKRMGVDIPAKDALGFAVEARYRNTAEAIRRGKEKRDKWLYENLLEWKWAVDYAGSANFKIRLSPCFADKKADLGTFILKPKEKYKGKVVNLEALAEAVAREQKKDPNDVEQMFFDFFSQLDRPALYHKYAEWKNEQNYADKKAEREAREEFMQQEKYRVEDEVIRLLETGQPVTAEWIAENKPVWNELYRRLMNKEPGSTASKIDIDAVNAALAQQSDDASTYARAWKDARQKSWDEFQQKLAALRESVNRKKADTIKLQRDAAEFAEKNLPKEYRAEFLRRIIGLLDMGSNRRAEAFQKIMADMTQKANTARRDDAIGRIRKLLEQYRVTRTYKGIPVSKLPTVQVQVNEISKIFRLSPEALEVYRGAALERMTRFDENSEMWMQERDRLELSSLFGDLALRDAQAGQDALAYLENLITGGKETLRKDLEKKLERLRDMRLQIIRNLTGGVVDATGKDAKKFRQFKLQQVARLESLLQRASGLSVEDFDKSVFGQIVRDYNVGQEREMTKMRRMDDDVHEAAESIFGLKGMYGFGKFLKDLTETIAAPGVSRKLYTAKVEGDVTIIGRRPAIRNKINWRIAEKALGDFGDADFAFIKPQDRRTLRGIIARFGDPQDDFALFYHDKKVWAYVFNAENKAVSRFEVPLKELPAGCRFDTVSDIGRHFAQRQVNDCAAGIVPVDPEFNISAADAQYQALKDDALVAAQVELISDPPNLKSSDESINDLSRDEALQLILTWEQPEYKDTMRWNGFDEKTMKQLYDFVGEKYLTFGRWMRDYVSRAADELDRISKEKYGVGLPRIENYFPGRFQGLAGQTIPEGKTPSLGGMSMNPSFLIARRGHLKAPDIHSGAFGVFKKHMQNQVHFLELNDVVGDLRGVFNDLDVKAAINSELGKDLTMEILRRIGSLATSSSQDMTAASKLFGKMYRHFVPSKLALSLPSMFKQMGSALNYEEVMPLKEFWKYHLRALSNREDFRSFRRWAWNSDFMKNRWAGGLNPDLVYLANHTLDSDHYSPFLSSLLDRVMTPTKAGDAYATIYGGYAVYAYTRDSALRQGATEAEAEERARYAWMKATDETQQSSKLTSKNYFMENPGGQRFLTMFLTNPIQTMDLVSQSIDEVRLGRGGSEARRRLARQLFVSHIIIPSTMFVISHAWRHGFDLDEWNWEDYAISVLLGSFEGALFMSLIRPIAEKVVRIAEGKPVFVSGGDSSVPVISAADNAAKTFGRLAKKFSNGKEITPREMASGVQALGDAMIAGGAVSSPVGTAGAIVSAAGLRAGQILRWFEGRDR